jgi:hypothetical protein
MDDDPARYVDELPDVGMLLKTLGYAYDDVNDDWEKRSTEEVKTDAALC